MVKIIFEDADLLIVEKPAGISTQPLPTEATQRVAPTLAHQVAKKFPEIRFVGGSDWGAAHRLDRETSGLVVFARNEETYRRLREMFSKNAITREYTAFVEGVIQRPGKINWPIGPDPKSSKRVKVYKNVREARRHGAQEAVTLYSPLSNHLLRILIKTGRRHQIRAHLAAIGHPVLKLHASRLKFRHPRTSLWVEVESVAPFSSPPEAPETPPF